MSKIMVIIGLLLSLTACTWVKLNEAGKAVSVAAAEQIANCEHKGRVTAVSRSSVAGVTRSEKKLATELETIARNEAPDLGGDTVMADGAISGDEQTFQIYKCR